MIIEDSSTLPTPIDSGAGRVTAFDQLPGIPEGSRRIADTAGHASRKTRILRTKKRSIALPRSVRNQAGVARSETKHILHLMRKFHISNEEILQASPALRRNLTQRLLILSTIFITLLAICSFLYSSPPFLFAFFLNTDIEILRSLSTIMVVVVVPIVLKLSRDDDSKRYLKYGASLLDSFFQRSLWWIYLALLLPFLLWLYFDDISRANRLEFILACTETILFAAYFSLVFKTQKLILRWRAPDLVLVRALADAFKTVADGGPAVWRSIATREKAAAYVSEAANVIEGIARKFVRSAGDAGAGARLLAAGAALRQKVAWLATPQPDTRDFLARVLAKELLIAATGDLDRLECAEITDSLRAGRLARFVAIVSWAVITFGPAVFLVIGKLTGWWLRDEADVTTAIVSQFAVLCVFVGIVSGIGSNDYKEKLGSVLSMGGTLFGWKR